VNTQPDYTSAVPNYAFATTLDAQRAQLADNLLLRRFAESRRALSSDSYRPLYHYVSPESTMNDPNGLCFWQGRWHLFYQGYPPEDPRQHWGHAVSDDLIHWQDLPYAIYPHPEFQCFSGSTMAEADRVIAIYHGTRVGNMVAVSDDPLLLNWEKLTGQPVIPISGDNGAPLPYRIHDPCIWTQGGCYYALSNGRDWWRPMDYLFRSDDLVHWEYLHPFVENQDAFCLPGDDGACPYFLPIGGGPTGRDPRHILLYFSHMSGGQALLGDYDTERQVFVPTSHHDFNFGPYGPAGVHAPSAAPDSQGAVIVIFNMNPGKPTPGWNQIMTLPRRLTLLEKDLLGVEPAGDVGSLRGDHVHVGRTLLAANREVVLEGIQGNTLELLAEIDDAGAPLVELNVLRAPDRSEHTRIAFYRDRGYHDWDRFTGRSLDEQQRIAYSQISVDTSYSSVLPDVLSRAPETAPVLLEPGEPLRLRVFVDRSVVEVFVNGKQCLAVRVYPGHPESVGVSLRAQGRDAVLRSLDAWEMKSIYP
jgi:beta-fructofuranosidase